MRRRWIAALVLATALVFLIAGTALGYWVLPEDQNTRAECRLIEGLLDGGLPDVTKEQGQYNIDYYNENCR